MRPGLLSRREGLDAWHLSHSAASVSSAPERVLEPTGTPPLLRDGYAFEGSVAQLSSLPVACKSLLRIGASRGQWQCLALIYADCAAVDRTGVRRRATCQIQVHPDVAWRVPPSSKVKRRRSSVRRVIELMPVPSLGSGCQRQARS